MAVLIWDSRGYFNPHNRLMGRAPERIISVYLKQLMR